MALSLVDLNDYMDLLSRSQMPYTTCYAPQIVPSPYAARQNPMEKPSTLAGLGTLSGISGLPGSKVVNNRCLYCRSVHQANKCPNCGGNEYE